MCIANCFLERSARFNERESSRSQLACFPSTSHQTASTYATARMRDPAALKDSKANSSPTEVTALLEQGPVSPQYVSLPSPPAPKPATWASIPKKGQLAVIVFARLAEPLSERSLASYLFYQLRWLNGDDKDISIIAKQAGYLTAVFAAAQCLTSMCWGRVADHPALGRKQVLVIGLTGSTIAALGMGFATSLPMAFFFRFLAGALNGNVGVLRTMVSEIVVDKR